MDFFTHGLRGEGLNLMQSKKQPHKFISSLMDYAALASAQYDLGGWTGIEAGLRAEFTPRYDDATPVVYPYARLYVDLYRALLAKVQSPVSTLKINGGYGRSGRDTAMPYAFAGNFLTGDYPEIATDGYAYYDGFNRVISSGWHLGAELGLWNDRLNLAVSYYDHHIDDRYTIYSFGEKRDPYWEWCERTDAYSRESSFRNRGIEFDLSADLIVSEKLSWNIRINGAYENSQMEKVDSEDFLGRSVGNGLVGNVNVVGHQAGSLFGYRENADGSYADVNRDGRISEADKVILGNTTPEFYGSVATTLRYRDFTLDLVANGAARYDLVNLHRLALDGKEAVSSGYVEDGSFLRLARVSIGYDIPLKAKWIRSLKVSVSGLNLLTWTGYDGWNPDTDCFGRSPLSRGYDYGSFPLQKPVIIGISANF